MVRNIGTRYLQIVRRRLLEVEGPQGFFQANGENGERSNRETGPSVSAGFDEPWCCARKRGYGSRIFAGNWSGRRESKRRA